MSYLKVWKNSFISLSGPGFFVLGQVALAQLLQPQETVFRVTRSFRIATTLTINKASVFHLFLLDFLSSMAKAGFPSSFLARYFGAVTHLNNYYNYNLKFVVYDLEVCCPKPKIHRYSQVEDIQGRVGLSNIVGKIQQAMLLKGGGGIFFKLQKGNLELVDFVTQLYGLCRVLYG